jgi:hypothetical protein
MGGSGIEKCFRKLNGVYELESKMDGRNGGMVGKNGKWDRKRRGKIREREMG